ncbi:putative DNA repair protein Dds20/Mei5 [Aspergillus thermomutatus]|uniref:Uncharacterized protein n=1 Tax=Aspergillus thermomutatus TaxID=41047 RepID=A0A397GB19_ASPTH|nr:uncharacterized protein CDV56_102382 [Aspergillus thermomutatus]RHZ45300.1 hypothetical protein CDV56_102382 [Aspergillus thermomutatus]
MASVTLNGKRRRIEDAASSLSKPFKSPLRKPVQGIVDKEKASSDSFIKTEAEGQLVDGKNAQEHLTPSTPISSKPTRLASSSPASPFPSLQNQKRKPTTNQITPSKKSILADPVISELQKEQRALQCRLSALRSELDTVQQALRIESSTKDAELEALILKWKTVSQEAAEEVFEGARERVSRMGGMKAWRERMQSDSARWEQEEMNSWYGNAEAEGFEADEGELEQRKAELFDEVEMPRKEQEVGAGKETPEDEEFTMDIMLKTLNIDMKVDSLPSEYLQETVTTCIAGTSTIKSALSASGEISTDRFTLHVTSPQIAIAQSTDSQPMASRLEGPLISRLAYEAYPDQTEIQGFSQPDIGALPALASVVGCPGWLEEVYADLYFSITHWVWPFLDQNSWKSWQHEWSLDKNRNQWKGFFVHMVYAVGALSCNHFQFNEGHFERAAELNTIALSYYPYVMEHSSTILQIQASVLMILYALHCPSAEEISTTVSSIIPFCTATIAEIRRHTFVDKSGNDLGVSTCTGEFFTESLFITCYMLNEIIVSGWDRPVSAAYKAIDDDMLTISNGVPSSSTSNTALSHLFRLRKIQANIRRYLEDESEQTKSGEVPRDDLLKKALDTWRKDIPRYGLEGGPCTYLHPLWMANLYDYSIIILMQEKRDRLKCKDIEDVLCAIVEVCLNFRQLQEDGQVMCYTWSALVFQFRAGVMLLYLFWVTVREERFIRQALEALEACLKTIAHFADRWKDAVPYKTALYFLIERANWISKEFVQRQGIGCSVQEMERCWVQLKKQYLHKAVLGMIEDMIYKDSFG